MKGYYHTDDPRMMEWLENVLRTAREQGRRVRFNTEDGNLIVKVGEGQWTAPFRSTPDPYRDPEPTQVAYPRLTVGEDGKPRVDLTL